MCKKCSVISSLFDVAGDNPHINYMPTVMFLQGMEKNEVIELYAGDCLLRDTLNVLYEEKHYTVCHYLRCKECSKVFQLGACIRGTPIYKQIDIINKDHIDKLLWGNQGTMFMI